MVGMQRGPTQIYWIRIAKGILQTPSHKLCYERADCHSNLLIVESCKYAPHPNPLLRRPHSVLLDLDDPITAANALYIDRSHSSVSRHTLLRCRRRRGQFYFMALPSLGATWPNGGNHSWLAYADHSPAIANRSRALIKARTFSTVARYSGRIARKWTLHARWRCQD